MSLTEELFGGVPLLDQDTEICEEATVSIQEIQQWQCSDHEQYSPIILTGNADDTIALTHSSTQSTQSLLPAIGGHHDQSLTGSTPSPVMPTVAKCNCA